MDETSQRVGPREGRSPQDHQKNPDCPQHPVLPSTASLAGDA
jgi:hypothetical protein